MTGPACSAFAVLTPPGRGGIAVVRVVGPQAEAALRECFRPARRGAGPGSPRARTLLPGPGSLAYGHLLDSGGRPLDEVILHHAATGPAPAGPTPPGAAAPAPAGGPAGHVGAPPVYEVNCHGGPAAVAAVCGRLEGLGLARADADALLEMEGAGPVEREARRRLARATTLRAARILLDQLAGALARAAGRIDTALAAGRRDEAAAALDGLLASWRCCGRFLADPPRLVIAGRPNVGKSTLLNRMAGAERAITSAAPGTTRDYVETEAAVGGLPVVLVDTAGLREARDGVERQGVERARGQAAGAALVVYLLSALDGETAEDAQALAALGDRALAAWNKADAAPMNAPGAPPALRLSALTGDGVEALGRAILARLDYREPEAGAAVPFAGRQAEALERARQSVEAGRLAEARGALVPLLAGRAPAPRP